VHTESTSSAPGRNPKERHALDAGGFILSVHKYLNSYIQVADAKAGFVLAASGAGTVLALPASSDRLVALNWVAVVIFGLAIVISASILYPRHSKKQRGLVYWENIAHHPTIEKYADAFGSKSPEQLELEFASQAWYLSKVLSRKYWLLRAAMVTFAVGIVFGLVALIANRLLV